MTVEPREYRKMAALQRGHWWFDAKRRMARALLGRHVGGDAAVPRRVLEVGCGTGAMSPVFAGAELSVGVDLHAEALAHVRGARAVVADALALPFGADSFDGAGCFDLLYHRGIPDVGAALREIARVVRPGGSLLITDSACPALFGSHDRAHHGARRFTRRRLCAELEGAGFEVVHASHLHVAVFPLVWASRVGGRLLRRLLRRPEPDTGSSQLSATPAPLDVALGAYYRIETAVASRLRLPFGVTVVAVARVR